MLEHEMQLGIRSERPIAIAGASELISECCRQEATEPDEGLLVALVS